MIERVTNPRVPVVQTSSADQGSGHWFFTGIGV